MAELFILTENTEIKISTSINWYVIDEISNSVVASICLQIIEREGKVHWFIAQTKFHMVDAKSIQAINYNPS